MTDELNRPPPEKGIKDARKVTELLSHENITKVKSSPYKRAIQTVVGTSNYFGLSILIDEGFRERKLADSSVTNFDEVILKYWENFNFSLNGGEAGFVAQYRGVQSLKGVLIAAHMSNILRKTIIALLLTSGCIKKHC
ncbi:MAG: histidine phosphatase family protein [Bacillota bacterium]|nr:histidine phosphatase family protein [Bacillota bacterium]